MDEIFRALADPTRRLLLDSLKTADGQTLTALEQQLTMTRFGVMKHLKLLEEAHLVVTRKVGRKKFHYLNVVPLQEMVDRWIEPITRKPTTRAMLNLKSKLEGDNAMSDSEKPDFVLETFIRTTPEVLWKALTSSELTKKFNISNAAFHGQLAAGERYEYRRADGSVMLSGEIISAEPFSRLEMTFVPGWGDAPPVTSRNIYEIEQRGTLTKLTVLHFGITEAFVGVKQGWSQVIASLKSLLETGEALDFSEGVAALPRNCFV